MVFDAERRGYAKVRGLHVARSRPGPLGGCVGTGPHRPLPAVSGCPSRARRSGVPARGPCALSAAEERQLLPRCGQTDRPESAALRHRPGQPDPERAFRPRARLPPPRHAGAHPGLDLGDVQLPSPGGTGAWPLGARQQRADPRRCGRVWRDARRPDPALLRQLESVRRARLDQQGQLRGAAGPAWRGSRGAQGRAGAGIAGARLERLAPDHQPRISHGPGHRHLSLRPAHAKVPQLDEGHCRVPAAAAPPLLVRAVLGLDGAHRRCLARLHLRAARAGGHLPHPLAQLPASGAVRSADGSRVTKTVLVLRFSAVGDVVLTGPAIHALRIAWPDARIVYAVKQRLSHLVEHNPNVDDVIALRDALPVKLALRPYHASMLFADRYHAAVEQMVGRELPKGKLEYFLGPDDLAVADAALRAAGVDPHRPLLGLSPGANWATKRWPVERFAGLARRALERGLQVAVQGSASEAPLGTAVARLAPGAVDLSGKLDLRGLGGFIARCTAFAANDSGPMHMARALGVPTLAFFGSTDPTMFDFRGHEVLFAGIPCAPCSFFGRRRCPRGHFRCMLDLTEERAWGALSPLLSAGRLPLLSA